MTVDANPPKASHVTASRSSWLQRRVLSGNRLHKWLILVLVAGVLGLYGWHAWRVHELRGAQELERSTMTTQVEGAVDAYTASSLRVTAMALGWAASQAMQREDLPAMNVHLERMVKEGPVKVIAVLGGDGLVRVSTNKKHEGMSGSAAFPDAPLTATELTVREHGAELTVVAPLDDALGAAVLVYDRLTLPDAQAATAPAAGQPTPTP